MQYDATTFGVVDVSELLDNTGYAWTYIVGGTLALFDVWVWFAVLAVWTLAGLYRMHDYDPMADLE